ncbi:hypothetical protein [Clostridium sp. AN503]|mgnify:CR=1 FL=1|uniref:hypothetical protein n=1 Tax=Clostridium sp. AN503 TaxID=3160598 RepID=UPI00345B1DF5
METVIKENTRSINGFSKSDLLKIKGIAILLMMFHYCFGGVNRFESYDISFYPFLQPYIVKVSWSFKICVRKFKCLDFLTHIFTYYVLGRWLQKKIGCLITLKGF